MMIPCSRLFNPRRVGSTIELRHHDKNKDAGLIVPTGADCRWKKMKFVK